MALDLLAGPFDIVADGAVVTDPSTSAAALYDDDIGFYAFSGIKGGLLVAQLDGCAYLRAAQRRANAFALDLQNPGEYLIHDSFMESGLYRFNKRAATFGDLVIESEASGYVSNVQVRTPDRYLHIAETNVQFKPLTLVGSWSYEASLSGAAISGGATVSRTRDADVLAVAFSNGTVVFYDWVKKAQVGGVAFIGTNAGAWYSPRHDIFVALVGAQLKVLASSPRPSTISNPVAVTPLAKGRASFIKARLLGSNSEPCPDEVVDWALSGPGALELTQSVTDSDGWAWNTYVAPPAAGGTPSITAEVRF
ncbi:hypothetical protein BJN34_12755 [Cupriavidus necator]|uniref:Uncharacterized protein n=1 Tax=Cupriavidus necator TaxID=106590 RepID=A0A1U9UQ60_CUPNE|nr:hypothetical protein [Cupriavidus necator]AQV94750.1 hypothetical protein BJN34_12755 [Cupriavidus necator]